MTNLLPKKLRELPLGLLHLAKRTHNSLERAELITIGDLFSLSDAELTRTPRLGPASLKEIEDTKEAFLGSITESGDAEWFDFWKNKGVKIIPSNFDEDKPEEEIISELPGIIKEILEQNADDRLWFIIQRRLGLEGTEKLTLEELGLAFGLTRERVRQLEAFALSELKGVLIQDYYKEKTYHVHPKILKAVKRISGIVTETATQAILEEALLKQIEFNFNIQPDLIRPSIYLILSLSGLSKLDFDRSELQPVWGNFQPTKATSLRNSIERLDKLMTEENALPLSEIDVLVQINKRIRKRNRISLEQLGPYAS